MFSEEEEERLADMLDMWEASLENFNDEIPAHCLCSWLQCPHLEDELRERQEALKRMKKVLRAMEVFRPKPKIVAFVPRPPIKFSVN